MNARTPTSLKRNRSDEGHGRRGADAKKPMFDKYGLDYELGYCVQYGGQYAPGPAPPSAAATQQQLRRPAATFGSDADDFGLVAELG
jgi:hypothetical protein